jgi:hypothetical protein
MDSHVVWRKRRNIAWRTPVCQAVCCGVKRRNGGEVRPLIRIACHVSWLMSHDKTPGAVGYSHSRVTTTLELPGTLWQSFIWPYLLGNLYGLKGVVLAVVGVLDQRQILWIAIFFVRILRIIRTRTARSRARGQRSAICTIGFAQHMQACTGEGLSRWSHHVCNGAVHQQKHKFISERSEHSGSQNNWFSNWVPATPVLPSWTAQRSHEDHSSVLKS